MSIFKVLITRTKIIPIMSLGGYMYDEESRAYSDFQYFSTLENAQVFCHQYLTVPFFWEHLGEDLWYFEHEGISFNIYLEEGSEFDTLSKPPLPGDFAVHHHPGD